MNIKQKFIHILENLDDDSSLRDIQNSCNKLFSKENDISQEYKFWKSRFGRIMSSLTFLLCIFTISIMTNNFNLHQQEKFDYLDLIFYGLWVMLPPIWFLFEYVWLFPNEYKNDSNMLSDFKYTQDLANKIWGAAVIIITAILYIKYGTGNLFPKIKPF